MTQILSQVKQWLALYGLNVIGAVVILVLGLVAAGIITSIFRRILRRSKVDETVVSFGGNIFKFLLITVAVIAALSRLGVQTASLIAVLGAAGLAVGLALRAHLSNLAAGILILVTRPMRVGDLIETSGVMGSVEEITILSTRIKTPDGRAVFIPNTKFVSEKLINYSAKPIRRIDLEIGVGYGDDLVKAKEVVSRILAGDAAVLDDPAPRVDVMELADSSVNLAVRPWVNKDDWWDAKCRLTESIKLAFDAADISIPYPQKDVHLFYKRSQSAG